MKMNVEAGFKKGNRQNYCAKKVGHSRLQRAAGPRETQANSICKLALYERL